VTLSNPSNPNVPNPVGLDNIVVVAPGSAVPEPEERRQRRAMASPPHSGPAPTPLRPGDDLDPRRRTVSKTGANTLACTSAYQPNPPRRGEESRRHAQCGAIAGAGSALAGSIVSDVLLPGVQGTAQLGRERVRTRLAVEGAGFEPSVPRLTVSSELISPEAYLRGVKPRCAPTSRDAITPIGIAARSTDVRSPSRGFALRNVRFAPDSPLEGDGFEPSVPRQNGLGDRGFRDQLPNSGMSGKPPRPFARSLPLFQLGESIAGDPDQLR
jgi:hypothetical protein